MLSMCVVLFGALTSSAIPFQSCLESAPGDCGIDLEDKNWGCGSSASSPLCIKQVGCLADKVKWCLGQNPEPPATGPRWLHGNLAQMQCQMDNLRVCGVPVGAGGVAAGLGFCADGTLACLAQWQCIVSGTNRCLGVTAPVGTAVITAEKTRLCLSQVEAKCPVPQACRDTPDLCKGKPNNCKADAAYACAFEPWLVQPSLETPTQMQYVPQNAACLGVEAAKCRRGRAPTVPCRGPVQCLEEVDCGMRAFNKCWGKKVLPETLSLEKLYTRKDCAKPLGDSCGYNTNSTTAPEAVSRALCGMSTLMACAASKEKRLQMAHEVESCLHDEVVKGCQLNQSIESWACSREMQAQNISQVGTPHCAEMLGCTTAAAMMCVSGGRRLAGTAGPSSEDSTISMDVWLCLVLAGAVVALCVMLAALRHLCCGNHTDTACETSTPQHTDTACETSETSSTTEFQLL